MNVVIVGVGETGYDLAENLGRKKDVQLVLIDADEKRCDQLASAVDALVLHGDGANPEILRKARVPEADVLIATTGADAINIVIAMLGHQMGVDRIMVKLNDAALRPACHEIGVSKIVTPKVSAASDLLAALYGFDRLDLSLVLRGGLRLLDLSVGEAAGKRLEELQLPEEALIIAVLREHDVLLPRKNMKLDAQDTLLTLIESDAALEKVRSALSAS